MSGFAELEAAAAAQLDRMRGLAADIAAVRGEHTSADGAATAVADGSGRLIELRLSERISRMSPEEFEKTVVAAAAGAARRALAVRGELVEAFNGQVNNRRTGELGEH